MINLKQKRDLLSYWNYFFLIPIAIIWVAGGFNVLLNCKIFINNYGYCYDSGLGTAILLMFTIFTNIVLFLLGMLIKKQRENWLTTLILAGIPIIVSIVIDFL